MQVLLAAVLVDALHAALEHGEVALNRVRVDDAANVLLGAVSGHLMVGKGSADFRVDAGLVRVEARFLDDVGLDNGSDRLGLDVIHHDVTDLTSVAVKKGQHLHVVVIGALFRGAGLAADEGLVSFDGARGAGHAVDPAHRSKRAVAHGLADTVREEPRALIGDAKRPVDLVAADALLRGTQEVDGLEHLVERDMGALKYGADLDGELLAALLLGALPQTPAGLGQVVVLRVERTTMRTDRAIRPELRLEVGEGRVFAVQVGVGQGKHW